MAWAGTPRVTWIDAISLPWRSDTVLSCIRSNASLQKTFLTALLLTGGPKGAETAMLQGIELLNEDNDVDVDEQLLLACVVVALQPKYACLDLPASGFVDSLPVDLRRVLRLPVILRACFVLRVLVGISNACCAGLLRLPISQINQNVGVAAQLLAEDCTGNEVAFAGHYEQT